MNTDLLIAVIIAGSFFLFLIAVFVQMFVHEWLRNTYIQNDCGKSNNCKTDVWIFAEE